MKVWLINCQFFNAIFHERTLYLFSFLVGENVIFMDGNKL